MNDLDDSYDYDGYYSDVPTNIPGVLETLKETEEEKQKRIEKKRWEYDMMLLGLRYK